MTNLPLGHGVGAGLDVVGHVEDRPEPAATAWLSLLAHSWLRLVDAATQERCVDARQS
jgi:hypothetical protein